MPWNSKSAKGNRISFSEANALSQCEERWSLQYRHHEDRQPGDGMLKGTLLHTGADAFWDGEDWETAVAEQWHADDEFAVADSEILDDAQWLLDRYTRYYADMRDDVEVYAKELELTAKLPGTKVTLMGHIDHVWRVGGHLYVVERKSYGRRDRLDLLPVDPQISSYVWLARQNGLDVAGVLYDGIYTHRWTPTKPTQKYLIDGERGRNAEPWKDFQHEAGPYFTPQEWARMMVEQHPGIERELSASFDYIPLDRTDEQCELAIEGWLKPALSRRTALRRGATPVRNIGMACKWCPAKPRCWEALAFGGDIPVQSDDD